jgi:HSP20 family protein
MSIFDEFERFMRRWQKFFEEIERQVEEDTDIVEENDKIKVVIDMPGVEKEDIKVYVSEDGKTLTVDAKGKDRKYHKEIRLPAAVDPNKAKATYKNGVLSVELEKVEKKKRGFEIRID